MGGIGVGVGIGVKYNNYRIGVSNNTPSVITPNFTSFDNMYISTSDNMLFDTVDKHNSKYTATEIEILLDKINNIT